MTVSNKIEGIVRLISPLHCATVDNSEGVAGQNKTFTHKQTVLTKTGSQRIPYYTGNGFRGGLRRKAAKLVLDHITSTGKVKVELYAGLMGGSITASPESDVTLEEGLRALENVYMGLFGGGTRMLRSRYCVNDLIPIIQDTIDAGIVPASFGEEWVPQGSVNGIAGPLTGYHLCEARTSFRLDDVASAIRPEELDKYIEDSVNAVAAKQSAQLLENVQRKSDKAAAVAGEIAKSDVTKKRGGNNMFAVESIVRGTPMHFLVDFKDDVSDAHVGLMLLSLQALVREQALGGWIRAGFGRYSANLTLTRNGQKYAIFCAGKNAADATLTDEVQTAFCEPALAALAELTAESMMEFFTPRKVEADAKPAKGKKKAAESEGEVA
jgi:CRISPR type IV-associated protein Csf2